MTATSSVVRCDVDEILCPTEFSPCCARILVTAVAIAEHFDASVRILHVWKSGGEAPPAPVTIVPGERVPLPPSHPPVPLLEDMRTLINHVPEASRWRLAGEIASGGIRRTILAKAEAAQLVVMGTRGLTGLPHVLLGSVAERIVARAPCPVLTLRPEAGAAFPRARLHTLSDGFSVLIRPIVAEDRDLLQKGIQQMSLESRYRRFMAPIRSFTEEQLRVLTGLDYRDHMAWGAVAAGAPNDVPIGSSRYRRLDDAPDVAEAAVVVIDAYQRRGVGTLLLKSLVRSAVANGIKAFRGYVLKENVPVQRMLEDAHAVMVDDGDCLRFDVALPAPDEEREEGPLEMVFKAIARRVAPGSGADEDPIDGIRSLLDAYSRLFK